MLRRFGRNLLRLQCRTHSTAARAFCAAPGVPRVRTASSRQCRPGPPPLQVHTTYRLYSTAPEGGGAEFEFDPMASVRHDAAVESAKNSIDAVLQDLAPPGAPSAALEKIRQYLGQHPVDTLIISASVQITHVQNAENGKEDRVSLSPCETAEALEQAKLRGMHLVQMGEREDVAFCRIRDERPWVLNLVQEEMKEAVADEDTQGAGHGAAPVKLKPLVNHQFRDVVDAHFVGWRSKKVCQDIRKGHPVKLTIKDFQSAESAINKLREMSKAMKIHAEAEKIFHHFTSIVANDKEASITFSPPEANKSGTISKTVKHPEEKDWAHALRRMEAACAKSGRLGTYVRSGGLKPRNVGTSAFRVDKYGRRID